MYIYIHIYIYAKGKEEKGRREDISFIKEQIT